jgi:iron-sulfur cluster assembly accessory protein
MSDTLTHDVTLTEVAAKKVRALIDAEGRDDLRLRIVVEQGGCAGFKYQLFFDEQLSETDAIKAYGDVELVVDEMSVPYLSGATIDFADTIQKQGFEIDNPNATGSCACGDSFS